MADPVFVDNVTPLDAVNMNKLQTRDEKAAANGYASLGVDGKVPLAQLPPVGGADLSFDGDWVAGTYQDGDVVVYNGIAYMCVGGPTTVAPDPALWGIAGPALPVSYGTTLPVAPANGQEAILVDSLTNPTYQWRFRYNAGSTSPYKWEFIGGADLTAKIATEEAVTVAGPTDLATPGPQVIAPRAGEYMLGYTASAFSTSPGISNMTMGGHGLVFTTGNPSRVQVGYRALVALTGGQVCKLTYGNGGGGGSSTFGLRVASLLPVRVS